MTTHLHDFTFLLRRARAGSRESVGQILEGCRAYLYAVAGANGDAALQAKAGASDLVQDTFLEAQRDFAQFGGCSEEEFLAWIRQLLLNNLANFTRSYRGTAKRSIAREVPLDPGGFDLTAQVADDALSPSGLVLAHEQADKLQGALARLPADYRQVLLLRYQEQLAFEEVARRMERSANAARKLWTRAVELLEREMRELP